MGAVAQSHSKLPRTDGDGRMKQASTRPLTHHPKILVRRQALQVLPFPQPPEQAGAPCPTPAFERMSDVTRLTVKLGSLGSIIAAPGVGKTTTLRHYADTSPGARYCAMAPSTKSMTAMMALVCEALNASPASSCARTHGVICNAIKWVAVTVLLVDEAQHLSDVCLDELRCIHDETGVPMVFAGNHSLRTRFGGGKESAFAQLTSRIGPRFEQKATTAADVKALAGHFGVTDPKAVSWLTRRCAGLGGLRDASRLLKLAGDLVKAPADIRVKHLEDAAVVLGGAK